MENTKTRHARTLQEVSSAVLIIADHADLAKLHYDASKEPHIDDARAAYHRDLAKRLAVEAKRINDKYGWDWNEATEHATVIALAVEA